jgi:DNA-binding transcriptional LysR family regulator
MRTRYKDLSLQQIRNFREVCRYGSYTTVSRRVRLSPSAVWEQVRGLERYFETPLVENVNGMVRPTADGQVLLELVSPMVAGLDTVKESLLQWRGRVPSEITIISGMRMLMDEIISGVVQFQQKYPGVRVKALYAEDSSIDRLVERGDADIAITLERGVRETSSLGVTDELAYQFDYLLICPGNHPLLRKRSLRLDDLVRYPLIVGAKGTRSRARIDELFQQRELGQKVHVAVETNSTALTFAAVRAGAGLGIGAAPLQKSLSQGLSVRSLRKWFGRSRYVFVRKRGAIVGPVQRELERAIVASAK